jgi:hypothetical protein
MEKRELLKLDYLPHILAHALHRHARLLQETARQGRQPARLKLDWDACFEVAKRQCQDLIENAGVLEIWVRARTGPANWSYHGPSEPEGKT